MPKKNAEQAATCPVDYAFQRIGGKYKGRIILALKDGVMRYGELRRSLRNITPKMLTQTLRELESDGLIIRKVYREVPPKVEYTLTANGRDFLPSLKVISEWGIKQMKQHGLKVLPAPEGNKHLISK